jgi:hypothetical protein
MLGVLHYCVLTVLYVSVKRCMGDVKHGVSDHISVISS